MSRASRHRILAAMLSACLLSLLGGCTPLTVLAVLGGCKDGGSNGSSGGVTGSVTTGEVRDGMTIAQTKAWFNGSDGPDNVCQAYPDGQCTWWACMRGHKNGLDVGSYWGNGGDWAASATAAGWKTTRTDPVAGSIVSYPPGVADADTLYGHVAVVEAVDRTAGTVTISEMNGRGGLGIVNHRTHRINVGAVYILPNGSVSTMVPPARIPRHPVPNRPIRRHRPTRPPLRIRWRRHGRAPVPTRAPRTWWWTTTATAPTPRRNRPGPSPGR